MRGSPELLTGDRCLDNHPSTLDPGRDEFDEELAAMDPHPLTRRRLLGLLGAAASVPVLGACGSSVGGGSTGGGPGSGTGGGTIRVGLVVPQSGVYAALG